VWTLFNAKLFLSTSAYYAFAGCSLECNSQLNVTNQPFHRFICWRMPWFMSKTSIIFVVPCFQIESSFVPKKIELYFFLTYIHDHYFYMTTARDFPFYDGFQHLPKSPESYMGINWAHTAWRQGIETAAGYIMHLSISAPGTHWGDNSTKSSNGPCPTKFPWKLRL